LTDARKRATEVDAVPIGAGGGATLRFVAGLLNAKNVVEVGTGCGVSGVWMIRGMRPDGVLTSVDLEAEHQRLAKRAFAAAGVAPQRVRLIPGAALDVLPRLTDVLGVATTAPVVEEVVVPEKKKSRWLKRLAVIGALGAVIAVVARRFLGNQDADWQAARPSTPYAPPTRPSTDSGTSSTAGAGATAAPTDDVPSADSTSVETVESTAATRTDQPAESDEVELGPPVEEDFAATEPAPIGLLNVDDSGNVEETVVDEVVFREPVPDLPEGEPVSDTLAADEPAPGERAARFSGEGVYVGHEPPEGYVIKGNERSMKYHMPEAAGYSRTIAEVWFNSEEAAQQAGFVRAQR